MPHLLSPLTFSGLTLRNRIVMPPMWSGQARPDGSVTDQIVEYHRVRASAGCGLVTVEHSFVHPGGRHSTTQIGAHDDAMIPGLTRLAAAITAEGAVACLQVSHAGSRTSSAVLGRTPVGPSAVQHPCEPDGEVPEPLTAGGIAEVIAAFGAAARRAREAGFAAVEIHAAHGFLLSQFLSPLSNQRADDYGAGASGRRRLHLLIAAEVRRQIGEGRALFVRLGACDEMTGGLTLDDACATAVRLEEAGVNLISVSGGLMGSRPAGREPGYFVPYAAAIKTFVTIPVMVTGGITDPLLADRIVRNGQADLVGVGRAMLNDPNWARKAIEALQRPAPTLP
jgi:2,4-dienoyl-CoA reductase-like NADH-dependent reductase (Old Yellow Enzyme family)